MRTPKTKQEINDRIKYLKEEEQKEEPNKYRKRNLNELRLML